MKTRCHSSLASNCIECEKNVNLNCNVITKHSCNVLYTNWLNMVFCPFPNKKKLTINHLISNAIATIRFEILHNWHRIFLGNHIHCDKLQFICQWHNIIRDSKLIIKIIIAQRWDNARTKRVDELAKMRHITKQRVSCNVNFCND